MLAMNGKCATDKFIRQYDQWTKPFDIGILAYGSIIDDPREEIESYTFIELDTITPFRIEFARSSSSRKGAPTLIPVDKGGSKNKAKILVLENVTQKQAKDILYRREINKVGTGKEYVEPEDPTVDDVLIRKYEDLSGVKTVFYTKIGSNIIPLHEEELSKRAIASCEKLSDGNDGISYLINAKKNGIKTPLMKKYEGAILDNLQVSNLYDAKEKLNCKKE